jgi:hypothetical protein
LHVLDDLWDFLTKSLFVAFNFWEPENSLFHNTKKMGKKCTTIIFLGGG